MDKYQTFLLRQSNTEIAFCRQGTIDIFKPDAEDGPVFAQNWDVRKKDYFVAVIYSPGADPGIEKAYAVFGNGEREFSPVQGKYVKYKTSDGARFKMGIRFSEAEGDSLPADLPGGVPNPYADREGAEEGILRFPVDFSEQMQSIRIVFRNNLADDLVIPVRYRPADIRVFRERAAAVQCGTGPNGATVFYGPCWNTYKYAEAEFFVVKKKGMGEPPRRPGEPPRGPGGTIPVEYMPMTKRRNAEGDFFISLQGIPYGRYAVILRQYDEKGGLLYETKKIPFSMEGTYGVYTL